MDSEKTQVIDSKGKTQVLTIPVADKSINAFISRPTAPLSYEVADFTNLPESTKAEISSIEDMKIIGESVGGVWGEYEDMTIYMPADTTEALYPPFGVANEVRGMSDVSKLSIFSDNEKLATTLKHYLLFDYSLNPDIEAKDRMIVEEDYIYNLVELGGRLYKDGNTVMYKEGKLIVQNERVKRSLILYLQSQIVNDYYGVLNYKNRTAISDYILASDFRTNNHQHIFIGKASILEWTRQKDVYKSLYRIGFVHDKNATIPQPFRSKDVAGGRVVLLQNVKDGKLAKAASVSGLWTQEGINYGFAPRKIKDFEPKIYPSMGLEESESSVFQYYKTTTEGDVVMYAAVLVLDAAL